LRQLGCDTHQFIVRIRQVPGTIYQDITGLVVGQTYAWNFAYAKFLASTDQLKFDLTGATTLSTTYTPTASTLTPVSGTFVATSSTVRMQFTDIHVGGTVDAGVALDNVVLSKVDLTAPVPNGSLTAGAAIGGATSAANSVSYTDGALDTLAGSDTITVSSTSLQSVLAAGGFIDGGAGVDTLKLAAGTTLDLTAITGNQTVKPIQEVEVFEMQGNSALTLNANDVLSLGGSNASTMSGYTFASTTGGSASASSTGKVQMVINGTSSDALTLKSLAQDGVTTNGAQGNTGLAGEWTDMGTTVISGTTYRVYNHSTTQAQVLSTVNASLPNNVIAFSSMTKDSGPAGANADWLTADASAGRLVSGTVATPLAAGDVVKVYANGTLMGNATVNAAGTAWEITDTNGYTGSWTYRADVVSSSNAVIGSSTQAVATDFSEAAPVITAVTDSASVSVANAGTTTNVLSTVSGTGNAGDTIYLYDNSSTNLVGSTVVGADGKWTVAGLNTSLGVGAGNNIFSAKQIDALGNESVLSNLWTVSSSGGTNLVNNGDFNSITGFTGVPLTGSVINFESTGSMIYPVNVSLPSTTPLALSQVASGSSSSIGGSAIAWSVNGASGPRAGADINATINQVFGPDSAFMVSVNGSTNPGSVNLYTSQSFAVTKGKTYAFELDYFSDDWGTTAPTVTIDGVSMTLPARIGAGEVQYNVGTFTGTYVANENKSINISINANNAGNSTAGGDFFLDDVGFRLAPPVADNTLTAGGTPAGTPNVDSIAYNGGTIDTLGNNDTITAGTDVQAKLAAGGFIDGGVGLDTLKLAAGTTLNLVTLTSNQTVKSIQQIESFELQGTSTLTLSANDVLSLGATDAFTGTAGKVQLLIKGTATDNVSLQNLLSDGAGGNTGLAGMWAKEASTATVGGLTYNVYSHSTTGAQVLISAAIPDSNVSLAASPLALDLNGDGVQTLNIDEGVLFDLMNTGDAQKVGWLDRNDGWLVMDLNQDGLVNSGAEMLGTSTKLADGSLARDGWQALAQYDLNTDGVIDAKDAAFADLKVWVDADSDGVSDAGELKTLANAGVRSINLAHDAVETAQNGNVLQGFSSFTTSDGQSHQIVDAWVQTSAPAAGAATFNLVNAKADTLNLSLTDVLKTAANTDGQHVVQVRGDAGDTVNLSNLLDMGAAQGNWQASGAVVQGGVTYNAYSHSADASLQVLIDQHITQVHAA
jgi:hypothetical protein